MPNTSISKSVRIYMTYLYCLVSLGLTGCAGFSLYIVNAMALNDELIETKNIPYGQHALNRLNIYIPKTPAAQIEQQRIVVVFFYGGCWGACQSYTKDQYIFVAQALTSKNFIAVLVDYRVYPQVRFATIMQDVSQSIEWIIANIKQYGGDANKVFLMGHSAGAHIAAMLNFNEKYLQPSTYQSIKGFIGLAGPYDFYPFTDDYQYKVFAPKEKYVESQPINFVKGTEPPSLLLYGKKDKMVKLRNIINLERKIHAVGGKVETHLYDNLSHVGILSALSIPFQDSKPVLKDIVTFIKDSTNPHRPH